jgi:hypothetical protein
VLDEAQNGTQADSAVSTPAENAIRTDSRLVHSVVSTAKSPQDTEQRQCDNRGVLGLVLCLVVRLALQRVLTMHEAAS